MLYHQIIVITVLGYAMYLMKPQCHKITEAFYMHFSTTYKIKKIGMGTYKSLLLVFQILFYSNIVLVPIQNF